MRQEAAERQEEVQGPGGAGRSGAKGWVSRIELAHGTEGERMEAQAGPMRTEGGFRSLKALYDPPKAHRDGCPGLFISSCVRPGRKELRKGALTVPKGRGVCAAACGLSTQTAGVLHEDGSGLPLSV